MSLLHPRRHSSLFERMQNEIKKMQKKRSAGKGTSRFTKDTFTKQKNNMKSFKSISERISPSIKKLKQSLNNEIDQKTTNLQMSRMSRKYCSSSFKRRHSIVTPIQTKETAQYKGLSEPVFVNNFVSNLHKQNSHLWFRLGQIQSICSQQSHRVGYLKGELNETNRKLKMMEERELKENIYLSSLAEHYKNKAIKYKRLLRDQSEISIESKF